MKTPTLPASLLVLAAAAMPCPAALIWQSPMDGNADATVGPNGTASGSPTPTEDRFGNPNSAVLFSGAGAGEDDHYNLGTIQSSLSAATFAAWVRVDNIGGGERGVFALGASGAANTNYFSTQVNGGANPRFRADVDDGNDAGSADRQDAFSSTITAGSWMHLAVTFSSGGELIVYIDGVAQPDVQPLPNTQTLVDLGPWLIGAERTTERFFQGAIDDVHIFDNVLSQSEIAALIPEPGVVGLSSLAGFALLRRRRKN